MSDDDTARPYEIRITSTDASGTTHEAHAEVRSSDPPEKVAVRILESLQDKRGKDYVRIIDPSK